MTGEGMVLRARRHGDELLSSAAPRWGHVQAVARRAEELAAGLRDAERSLVVAAAWLHDIGYAEELVATGFHALDGARHLERTNWPAPICALVAFHTGAEFEANERGMLEALSQFVPPPPHLVDALTAADLSVGPDGARVDPHERIVEILDRYDAEDPVHRAVRRSAPELLASVARAERRLALARTAIQAGSQPT